MVSSQLSGDDKIATIRERLAAIETERAEFEAQLAAIVARKEDSPHGHGYGPLLEQVVEAPRKKLKMSNA